ncbi:HisA/HisF-related TIM barrel protein [Methylomonas sp. SURF-2]|uniref:HisA/HisF-related TIM barrel protein n=1 Tax=Methylomonas subterranea TaxID=2952225 RepID=A0ABT1TJP2_9GAMM|nr:HisA/HisF-related TIM barrel protein [Methylomonas sp. SURF-2]MCQ8105696.1 HisA/HisF-related TIM barrel protein [Methylomonas sp. SURF-2]
MQIIPVIDLKDGLVVHAKRGERAGYQPIHQSSILTASSEFDAVMAGFLTLYPFKTFYIADLNAITGTGHHRPLIDTLFTRYPRIEFWIDNGSQLSQIRTDSPTLKYVIGTESQLSRPRRGDLPFVLSLDYKNQQAIGLPEWFEQSQFWPDQVIVMSLSRVGSGEGPDLKKLTELQRLHPSKHFIAAGGIRDIDDLKELKGHGLYAALLATALHAGSISRGQIENL